MLRLITIIYLALALNIANVESGNSQRHRVSGQRLRSLNHGHVEDEVLPIISPDDAVQSDEHEERELKKGKKGLFGGGYYGGPKNKGFYGGPKNKGLFGSLYDPKKFNKKGKANGYYGYNNGGLLGLNSGYNNYNYNNPYNRPGPNMGAILGPLLIIGAILACCAVKICTGCLI